MRAGGYLRGRKQSEMGNRTLKTLLVFAVAAPLLVAGVANAADLNVPNYFNSGQLLQRCSSGKPADTAICAGYIAASSDFLDLMDAIQPTAGKNICAPQGYSVGQLRAVIVGYLTANPKGSTVPAVAGVTMALSKAFPCVGS